MYNGQNEYAPYKKRTKRSLNDHRMHMRHSSGELKTCLVVDRSQIGSNGHQRMHTGYLQDVERMKNGETA